MKLFCFETFPALLLDLEASMRPIVFLLKATIRLYRTELSASSKKNNKKTRTRSLQDAVQRGGGFVSIFLH